MESLRVYPPVPMTIRKAGKSDHIEGVFVPKGTLLYIPIRVINTHTGFWGADAEAFRPERWADPPAGAHTFQSFINGPHHCIGRTMAIVEMKAVLALVVAHFAFEPAYEGQVAHPTAAVTMSAFSHFFTSFDPFSSILFFPLKLWNIVLTKFPSFSFSEPADNLPLRVKLVN